MLETQTAPPRLGHKEPVTRGVFADRSWLHRTRELPRVERESLAFETWAKLMADGRFEDAWRLNDLWGRHWPSAHRLWRDEAVQGANVTLRALHGLGDAVQMLRFAPFVSRLACKVRYEVPACLEPLLPHFQGVDTTAKRVAAAGRKRSSRQVELEMMELPYLFRTSLAELPLQTTYLVLPESVRALHRVCGVSTNKPRIGVVWSGGDWDRERWMPLRELKPLLQEGRIEWWNLQGGAASAEAAGLPLNTVSGLWNGGLLALAATIASMDVVLTVDTLAAHLAGALGVPTWLMLKRKADWRWMNEGNDSPWYPSMRIFRQVSPGGWHEVLAAVRQALDEQLSGYWNSSRRSSDR